MNSWDEQFKRATADIHSNCHFEESAEMLRKLIRTKLLKFTDLGENPERFFAAHRLLLSPGTAGQRGPGFGIRFTVQFNLFAGSILGLGGPEQIAQLESMQESGTLGCFCLTEKLAGVNSGLVVNTTATWVPSKQQFLLETPDTDAHKNWISQGLTARRAVVIANLIIDGKAYGPHGFVMSLRDENGAPMPGVEMTNMGTKTTANDLDNAAISFTGVYLEKSSLLNRFAKIENDKYVQTTDERMRLEVIGQRLLTGRMAIAQAGVAFARTLYKKTFEYATTKMCWAPKGQPQPSLAELPQLQHLFAVADEKLNVLEMFNDKVEKSLSVVLRNQSIPDSALVESIAVSKVKSIETAIDLCFKLKQEVGSYALMDKTGFEHGDFLQCCKFAEGDSRILMQKMARDSMKAFKGSSWTDSGKDLVFGNTAEHNETKIRFQLSRALSAAASPSEGAKLWNSNWTLVYALADAVCDRHFASVLGEDKVLSKL